MKPWVSVVGAVALASVGAGAACAAINAAQVIAARQTGFKQLGGAFKGLSDELKSPSPDKAKVAGFAQRMNQIAPQIPGWFPAGSGPEAGVKTGAKADIWSKPAEFQGAARALPPETAKMASLAAAGDMEGVQAQAKAVGAKCGACHTAFRQKD